MRPGVLLVLVLGTGAVAACSSCGAPVPAAAGFRPADVQRTIDSDLPRTFPGLRVGPARCPANLDPQPNKRGACAITVEGVPVRVRVDRTDGGSAAVRLTVTISDKKGSYTFQPEQGS